MGHIIIADDGLVFDGLTPERGPLGGAETAVVELAGALAARGHRVQVFTRCTAPLTHRGVEWLPLAGGLPGHCDLYIANRSYGLIGAVRQARQVFWTHNPCQYMLKPRYLYRLFYTRPTVVFVGDYHAATYPAWAPSGRRVVIPLAVQEPFLRESLRQPPPPRAVFTSNPQRGLDWLLDRWQAEIHPQVPEAELHLYCGAAVYGGHGAAAMQAVLNRARGLHGAGVVLHAPVPKADLIPVLRDSRVLLYRGDLNETYCLAVAEAQALGVPAVVQPLGSMPERVIDGETGFVAADDAAFSARAVDVLRDNTLWSAQHAQALTRQRGWRWDDVAAAFEGL
ncbi:glycosyltransferase family 4 protein [Novispirillum itersonii]|uniref:glycosyltransferase family 4 protein n=1 Tax=Novispirillum itersonii TaxID=189 RepID=UPI0003640BC9|nr:glycosyltransferase family 4 protein [Novispirillum itersonii]